MSRHPCPHDGCPAAYTTERVTGWHAATPHARCTCGRWMNWRSYIAHKRHALTYATGHRPFPRTFLGRETPAPRK